jgi:hypothetical protein
MRDFQKTASARESYAYASRKEIGLCRSVTRKTEDVKNLLSSGKAVQEYLLQSYQAAWEDR